MLRKTHPLYSAPTQLRRFARLSNRHDWTLRGGRKTSGRWSGEEYRDRLAGWLAAVVVKVFPFCHRERYRDLIDAADSIVDMKTCAEHVRCLILIFSSDSN